MSWLEEMAPHSVQWHSWDATACSPLDVLCFRGRSLHPLAVVTAGIHGDEYEGPMAVSQLTAALDPALLDGSVLAIPVANPGAFAAGTRTSPEDGLNLARAFPGNREGTATERLAAALFDRVASRADFLIDLHSGGVEYAFVPVIGFYGKPSTGNPSFQAALNFRLPALWNLPATPGVLSYEVWKRGAVSIGAEYAGAGQLARQGGADYLDGILSCLRHWGVMQPPTGHTSLEGRRGVFSGDWLLARQSGMFVADCRLGDTVPASATLARIVDPRGAEVERFVAPHTGVVLGIRSKAYIRQENWAILIGKPEEIDG